MLNEVDNGSLGSPCKLSAFLNSAGNHEKTPEIDFRKDLFDDAKFAERKAFHNSMENAYRKFLERNGLKDGASLIQWMSYKQMKSEFPRKLERLFSMLFISEKNMTVDAAIEEVKKLKITEKQWASPNECPEPIAEIKKLAEEYQILPSSKKSFFYRYLNEISEEIAFLKNKRAYENELYELEEELNKLDEQFKINLDTSKAYRNSTNEIIECLRKVMEKNIYRICKTNEDLSITQLVHSVSYAGYHDTIVSQNFESFGKKVMHMTETPPNLPLEEKVKHVWKTLYAKGVPCNFLGSKKNFSKKERLELVSEHASYGLEAFTTLSILPAHDQRKCPDNIPGALYEEEYQLSCNQKVNACRSRIVYTCNPTLGSNVAPEYVAVLQAMENRYFSFNRIDEDDYPYLFWNYTNLQNFKNPLENTHATILMRLNEQFPVSFRGITVTQNSPFYVAPVEAFNEDYLAAFQKELLHDDNFTLKNRQERHGGLYYFPAKDRKHWEEVIPQILSLAYATVDQNRSNHTEQELGAAFKELVHLGIMRHNQQFSLETLQRLTDRVKIQSIESRVCKSCIDRGGKITNEHFIAVSSSKEDDLAVGAFHGRPLLVARRLLLEEYTEAFSSLWKVVSRDVIKEFFGLIGKTVSPDSRMSDFVFRVL